VFNACNLFFAFYTNQMIEQLYSPIMISVSCDRLVHTRKQSLSNYVEIATFRTRSGTRQGVVEHSFRVESQKELVSWTVPLVQGVFAAVLAVKELSTRK
jgi:hypothetical protein